MFEIANLHAEFAVKPTLNRLMFEVGVGEVHAIMDPTSIGKSAAGNMKGERS
ncbi:MAG TPA: hypothetical protein VEA60_13355 [Allosphingosinicella sp.]|nr:hypothetical protein [Allosphingosinicella sp.]